MRSRRLIALASALLAFVGAACGSSGGPHSGAAPAVAHVSELTARLGPLGAKCGTGDTNPARFGGDPVPQEQTQCRIGKDAISVIRYRDFAEVAAALRLPGSRNVCAIAKVFHVPNLSYLYGDNWIVDPDPKFPALTTTIAHALRAGIWTLHCSGVTPSSLVPSSAVAFDDDPCRIIPKRDVTLLFGAPAIRNSDFTGTLSVGRRMTYCDWKAHSETGHVPGSIDYELIVGVMPVSGAGHYIEQPFKNTRTLSGIGDRAVYGKITDTATTVQFVKKGRLVVLAYGIGPDAAQNLDKGLAQADRLVATARAAAARM